MHASIDCWKPPTHHPEVRRRRQRRIAMLAAFAAVTVFGYGLADRLLPTEQTPTPCDGLLECREHLKRAAEERKTCVVGCAEAEARVAYYRASLKAGLEDEARQHSLVEQQAFRESVAARRERERKSEFERKLVADQEAHRQRLELLAARAEEQCRAEERDQTRRIDYFRRLTKDQRRERLVACHHSRGDCDALTQQLLRASSTSDEVRDLVETNERLTVEPTEVLALQEGRRQAAGMILRPKVEGSPSGGAAAEPHPIRGRLRSPASMRLSGQPKGSTES